jgi:hypothetical protein
MDIRLLAMLCFV